MNWIAAMALFVLAATFAAIAATAVYWAARDSLQARYEARMEELEANHRQERQEFEQWKQTCVEAIRGDR